MLKLIKFECYQFKVFFKANRIVTNTFNVLKSKIQRLGEELGDVLIFCYSSAIAIMSLSMGEVFL